MNIEYEIQLSSGKIEAIAGDVKKTAAAVNLIYVTDAEPGIKRIKRGESFFFILNNEKVSDEGHLQRISKLVIPPAWENVWICIKENGHIQCTGTDSLKRKQYRYHHLWNKLRSQTKFFRLIEFGEALPQLRIQLEKDIAQKNLTEEKVLATVISLMERTYIRVGNSSYEKLYGSYGLTTLKDKHVKIEGNNLSFSFNGKKGVHHNISLKDKRLANIVKQCRDIPGKELFQYKDEDGNFKSIDSGKVNAYIQNVTGKDFTAKDFRTWAGSINALQAFMEAEIAETAAEIKKKIVEVLDYVSMRLGNTRTVCKKYYVHPLLIQLYEDKSLHAVINKHKEIEEVEQLSKEEQLLLRILKAH
ncbi:MAG: DNA topoisomerase IB [Bacteroidia bacterium]